ncbi:hypothetical protein BSKO_02632 [Bryopsis sp. KO-2023]|nr:hypothetical protein BSKO_02632 [Bryopsis sp. KO-2023]
MLPIAAFDIDFCFLFFLQFVNLFLVLGAKFTPPPKKQNKKSFRACFWLNFWLMCCSGNVLCFLPVYIYAKSSRMPNGPDDFLLVLIVLFCIDVVKLGCAIRNFSQLQILNWCAHWDCRKPTWYFFHEAGVHVLISRSTRHSGIREKGTQGPSPTQRKNRS